MAAAESPALLGRASELADLMSAVESAQEGHGQIVLVAGDPGIGKTTLLEAVARQIAPTDVRMVWGHCWEGGGATAYWPWVQVLGACLADGGVLTDPDFRAIAGDVAHMIPEVAQRLGIDPSPPSDVPDARPLLFDAVAALLRTVASGGGLVVALEDLHAADEPSLHLLAHLARQAEGSRLAILGTYREAEVAASVRLRRPIDAAAAAGTHLSLTGLDEPAVGRLLEQVTGAAVTRETAQQVLANTDGNPFFVREYGHLLARGRGGHKLPTTQEVQALVHRRLERLAGPTTNLLRQAAVLGREFNMRVLSRISGQSAAALLDVMADAERRAVVEAVGLDRWSFVHALIREVLVDDLDVEARRDLHARAAQAITDLGPDDLATRHAALAHHYWEAGDLAEVAAHATAAADQAMVALAFEEAAIQFGRALEAVLQTAPTDQRWRYQLLMSLGRAQFLGHQFEEARSTHELACKAARTIGEPLLLAEAALAFFGYWGGGDRSLPILEEALAALPEEESAPHAQLLLAVAAARLRSMPQEWERWRVLADDGLGMARRLGDSRRLGQALLFWHRLQLDFDPNSAATRLAGADEAIRLATDAGDRETLFMTRQWRLGDLYEAGAIEAFRAEFEAQARDADQLRRPYLLWAAGYLRVTLAIHDGRFAEAEEIARDVLALAERTGSVDAESVFACQLLTIYRHDGRFEEMAEFGEDCRRLGRQGGQHFWSRQQALALALLGREREARRIAAEAWVDAQLPDARLGQHLLNTAAELTELCWVLHDAAPAEGLCADLLPFPERHIVQDVGIRSLGSTSRNLGQLATLLERFEEADAHFVACHRHHRSLRTPVWLAYGQADHARMLLARGEGGDADRAAGLARAARDAFRALGMGFYERRAAWILDDALRHTPRGDRGTFRLEGTEWAVRYAGQLIRLVDSKGMHQIAQLLAHPGDEVAALDLVSEGPPIDPERARQNVTRAVRAAINRIAGAHPVLGDHLRRTVRTGVRCSYVPDPRAPVWWDT